MDTQVDEYYKRQAKELTNVLFDKGFLASDLALESIDWLEDYLGFILKSQCQMAEKNVLLVKKVREYQVPKVGE